MPRIYQLPTPVPATVGTTPTFKFMTVGDNLTTISAAGYLNAISLEGYPVAQTDVLQVLYNYNPNTNTGTFDTFTVSITNGIITLIPQVNSGNVLLPVTNGHFAIFNGTKGQIKDAGYAPSNSSDNTVVMTNGSVTNGNLASFSDSVGTIAASSLAAGSVVYNPYYNSGLSNIFTNVKLISGTSGNPVSGTGVGPYLYAIQPFGNIGTNVWCQLISNGNGMGVSSAFIEADQELSVTFTGTPSANPNVMWMYLGS